MNKNNIEVRTVTTQDKNISYYLSIKKVRNINLRISRDGKISVSANRYVSKRDIDMFVIKNEAFIEKAMNSFLDEENNSCKNRNFETGEIITLFGNPYTIRVTPDNSNYCELIENFIVMHINPELNRDKRALIFYKFIDSLLIDTVHAISAKYYPMLSSFNTAPPKFRVRDMRSRYGSCKKSTGDITVNRQILAAPISAIRYLVCHELSHLVIPNHSKDFYNVLSYIYPDYKSGRILLRKAANGSL